jgi:multidrug transporter EmrE-like cation transporter
MGTKLVLAFFYGVLAQIISFLAIQGSYKIEFLKNNSWIAILSGIPVSYLLIKSVHYFIESFNGEIYPGRLIGQAIGFLVFSLMGWIMFSERLTIKSLVCMILAMTIVVIQFAWKTPKI